MTAVRESQKLNNEIGIKQQHHAKVTSQLQNAKAQLVCLYFLASISRCSEVCFQENLSHARESHTVERQGKLSELDQIINAGKAAK